MTQLEKALAFRALHQRQDAFILPNPWDAGTARLLAHLGFEALASTSAGFAAAIGKRDYHIHRDELLPHLAILASATPLPVSADLENGFGDEPKIAAETIRLAAQAGVVGGSIEDATGREQDPIYDTAFAAERVRAAAEAAHALPFPFTLTARCENFLNGKPDLDDTIHRLQAYQEAGADVLYAPGLVAKDDIATLIRSVDRPVNVLAGLSGMNLTRADLAALGVRRISVGSGLARAAFNTVLRAATEMREEGIFNFTQDTVPLSQIGEFFTEFEP